MLKVQINKRLIKDKISVDQLIKWVDDYDGMLLFTSENKYYDSQKSIIGLNPVISIYSEYTFLNDKQIAINNFEFINAFLNENKSDYFLPLIIGYLSFDFKNIVEERGLYKNLRDIQFPLSYFSIFEHYLIIDHQTKEIKHLQLTFPFKYHARAIKLDEHYVIEDTQLKSYYGKTNMPKQVFCDHVKRIKNYIKAGDIYQVNLTREINGNTELSFQEIAKRLYYSNNIEFGVIAKIENKFLISTSPERFFKIEDEKILTSPIKGTIKKIGDKHEDKKMIQQLSNDKKELAELAMIVDLLRNDIGKICKYDSVKVKGYPIIKELENVYHLVADIEGELKTNDIKKIIEGVFPGGSISGCPKIRACQIIEELEQKGRGPYTGSFGYFAVNGLMDFNILIRTLFYYQNRIWFNVGGGITLKSDPLKEYEETIHKASSIWEAINMEYIEDERYVFN